MRPISLFSFIFLTACLSPATSTPLTYRPVPPTPTYGLAGQAVLLQATQAVMQQTQAVLVAQIAEATARVQATAEALAFAQTAQAATDIAQRNELIFAQTAQAATQQAEVIEATRAAQATAQALASTQTAITFAQTADAATAQAQANQLRATTTAQAAEANATLAAQTLLLQMQERERASIVGQGFTMLLLFGIIILLLWAGYHMVRRLERRNIIVETRAGTLLLTRTSAGTYSAEVVQGPLLSAPHNDPFLSEAPSADSIAPPIAITARGQLAGWIEREAPHDAEAQRRSLLKFLQVCIKKAGPHSDRLPGFRDIGWSGDKWSRHKQLIADQLEARPGDGTYLVGEYSTLWMLWQAVGERRYLPHSPTPIERREC